MGYQVVVGIVRTFLSLGLLATFVGAAAGQTTWHVRSGALQGGDGMSWSTAFDSLQSGLDVAAPGDRFEAAAVPA